MEQDSDKSNKQPKEGRKRIDLNAAQVAGSAVAAVVAAKLASKMGVYGTVLGAGVISVIATCGGTVFQHVFKSTGERVRVVTTQAARPRIRRTPFSPSRGGGDRTVPLPAAVPPPGEGEFGEATTHGTRVRGWRRSAIAAALVFLVAMGGITGYELLSGHDLSGGKGTTTFGSVVRGKPSGARPAPDPDSSPSQDTGGTPDRTPGQGQGEEQDRDGRGERPREERSRMPDTGTGTGTGTTPTPGDGTGTEQGNGTGGSPAPAPSEPSRSADGGAASDPAPTPSSDTGADGGAAQTPPAP